MIPATIPRWSRFATFISVLISASSFLLLGNYFILPLRAECGLKNHEVISVYKEPEQGIVILDAKEYSSLVETLYLMSNPANRDRLHQGILQHQQGQVREIDVKAYLD